MEEDNDSKPINIQKEEKVDDGMNELSIGGTPSFEETQKRLEELRDKLNKLKKLFNEIKREKLT